MKNYVLVAVVATALLGGCKKDEMNAKTRATLLSSGSWKQTGAEYKVSGGAWANYYSNIESCTKDDIITFKADGTLTLNEGQTKCDPSYPQVATGAWFFEENEKVLSTDVGISAEIEILNETTLQIVFPDLANPENTNRSIYTH